MIADRLEGLEDRLLDRDSRAGRHLQDVRRFHRRQDLTLIVVIHRSQSRLLLASLPHLHGPKHIEALPVGKRASGFLRHGCYVVASISRSRNKDKNPTMTKPAKTAGIAQYIRQEILNLGKEFTEVWQEVIEKEGYDGVKKRSEHVFGKPLPDGYTLQEREFSRGAVLEINKELRCRSSDGKLSSILRPVNGIIKTAEFEAILDNSKQVRSRHVRRAIEEHVSLEGSLSKEIIAHKKDLKKYISALTDAIGYVVGLAVINSRASGQMFGQPLPIHCQINTGGSDIITAPGKIGDIAKAAS